MLHISWFGKAAAILAAFLVWVTAEVLERL